MIKILLKTYCKLDIAIGERQTPDSATFSYGTSLMRVHGHVRLVFRPLHLTMPLGSNILKGGNNLKKKDYPILRAQSYGQNFALIQF